MLTVLAVILTILKWIFIVIAIALGLVLVVSLSVLLVPVRYRIQGNYKDGKGEYCFRLSWLLHVVSIRKDWDSEDVRLRVFGIPIKRLSGDKKVKPKKKDASAKEDAKQTSLEPKEAAQSEPEEEKIELFEITPDEKEAMKRMKEERAAKEQEEQEKKKEQKQKKKGLFNRKAKKKKKEKRGFSFQSVSSIIDFIRDTDSKEAFRLVKGKAGWLIKYLFPHKIKGTLRFGFDDPANTGLVTGGLSMLPFMYGEDIHIYPNFEEKELEVEGQASSYIQTWFLIDLAIELYRSPVIRKWKKKYDHLKEEL